MFYWVYFTPNYTHKPLVLWLQGGPGASSTGIGNFLEIGPLDVHLKIRQYAWTNLASVVFVDSPVGSGFSYVWDKNRLARDDSQAASDLLTFLKVLYDKISDLTSLPLYIFGESYGAKIGAEFALLLTQAIRKKQIHCHLKGLALGSPWVSSTDSAESYAQFLYANSLIDVPGFAPLVAVADKISHEISQGKPQNATRVFFEEMEPLVANETNHVNTYNILADPEDSFGIYKDNVWPSNHFKSKEEKRECNHIDQGIDCLSSELSKLMNGRIKEQLQMPKNVTWSGQSSWVFKPLYQDFMKPAILTIETLLNETKLEVMIYNGQLDLIVPSIGTERWVRKLKWNGTASWNKAKRKPFYSKHNKTLGFSKTYKNLSFFWVLRAGHLIPLDAPYAAYKVFSDFIFKKH